MIPGTKSPGDKTLRSPNYRYVQAGQVTPLHVHGIGTMSFRYGDRVFTQDVVVADIGKVRAILGINFILKA